jgi:hypothetical protein
MLKNIDTKFNEHLKILHAHEAVRQKTNIFSVMYKNEEFLV